MSRAILASLFATIVLGAGFAGTGHGAAAPPGVDEHALRILRDMGTFLSSASAFSFEAELEYDAVMADGQKILYGARNRMWIRRPDRMRAYYVGDERESRVVYNGRTIIVHDLGRNVYATTQVPPKIGEALDVVFDRFGFSVPIADFLYEDPAEVLLASVDDGYYAGRHAVDGVFCHHLAFTQEAIDWQIWIEDGPQPVPRKLVITYKSEPGSPQYIARIGSWDFEPRLSESFFEYRPPADAGEIEFLSDPQNPLKEGLR